MPLRLVDSTFPAVARSVTAFTPQPMTYSIWIRLLKFPGGTRSIVGNGVDSDAGGGWEDSIICDSGGGLLYRNYDGGNQAVSAGSLKLGVWTHIAAQYPAGASGVTMRAWNNGVISGSVGGRFSQQSGSNRRLRIGGRTAAGVSGSNQTPPDCEVKDFAQWNAELPFGEIWELSQGRSPMELPSWRYCTFYWPLEQPNIYRDLAQRNSLILLEGPLQTSQIAFSDPANSNPARDAHLGLSLIRNDLADAAVSGPVLPLISSYQ